MSLKEYLKDNITTVTSETCGCGCKFDKIFENINENDTEFLNIKKYDLRKRYDFWDSKLFGGKLPPLDSIKFLSLRNKGATGICSAKVEYTSRSKSSFSKVWDSKIVLDNRTKYTQGILDSILIHEMIHWHFIGYLKVSEGHGTSFKMMASKLSKIVGFEIPLTDNVTTLEDREDFLPTVGIVIIDRGSKANVMFTSKNNFQQKMDDLIYRTLPLHKGHFIKDEDKITYGLGKFSKVKRYPLLRNFKKLKPFNIDYNDYLNNISWVDGSAKEIYGNEISDMSYD